MADGSMTRERLTRGAIQVYTGNGKGKTTTALGLAFRALGQGFKVYMVQFLKGRETGESAMAKRLSPDLTLRFFGRPGLVNLKSPSPADLAFIQEAWKLAREVIASGDYDLVILDEINLVLAHQLLPFKELEETLRQRPAWVEVVLTGRQAPPELLALADLITEMHPVKHYYQAGVKARRGIEW